MFNTRYFRFYTLFICSFSFAYSMITAQTFSSATNPVGIMKILVPNNSDTTFCVGFHRSVLFETTVHSVLGDTITINGNPAWEENSLRAEQHFLLFGRVDRESASEEGKFFPIIANRGSTLTLDLSRKGSAEPDPLSNLNVGERSGDNVLIVPCWTIGSLFAGIAKGGIEIWVFKDPEPGANNATPFKVYYSEVNGQWEAPGVLGAQDDLPIYPGESVFIRNESGQDQRLFIFGSVPMESFQTIVYTASGNQKQDIHIGLRSPVPIRLADSGLGEDGDELFVFDNDIVLKDKAASRIFEYIGDASTPGWYEGSFYVGESEQLLPGVGYILRKAPRGATSVAFDWKVQPGYLNSQLYNK